MEAGKTSGASSDWRVRRGNEAALIYVLDRKFLRPLKILHYSLYRQGAFQDADVVIITNDREVELDPFVRAIAHAIEFVDGAELKRFSAIRGERIDSRLQTDFAPKYTFLKLLMFRNRGYKRHIFIDADMLCLAAPDPGLIEGGADVKAVREFGASIFPIGQEERRVDFTERASEYLLDHSRPVAGPIQGINSGFLVLQGDALSDAIVEEALELASSRAFPSEQALTTEIVRRKRLSFLRLPIWYNARRRLFASMGTEFFLENRSSIILMHYTPGKPWIMQDHERRKWDEVWLDYEAAGREWIADTASSMI